MEISNINLFNGRYNCAPASFSGLGAQKLDLKYFINNHRNLLPITMSQKIEELLGTKGVHLPTLRELHIQTYAPLLECKTLDEARNLFVEFRGILDAKDVLRASGKTMKEVMKHCPPENLSLKLLQDIWGRLKTQNEIAHELGLSNYQKLDYIKEKILFPNRGTVYTNLLKASDPVLNAEIASKTRAYNLLHPDLMYAHNRRAAKLAHTPEAQLKHAQAIRQHYINHPEERLRVAQTSKLVWDRLPHIKEALKKFVDEHCSQYTKAAIHKEVSGKPMTEGDKRMLRIMYKKFWTLHPEFISEYAQMRRAAATEIRAQIEAAKH